jgi:hypothetical protein
VPADVSVGPDQKSRFRRTIGSRERAFLIIERCDTAMIGQAIGCRHGDDPKVAPPSRQDLSRPSRKIGDLG